MTEGAGLIVVGVDGSAHARRALDWAVREALLRGGRCLLVVAYDFGIAASVPMAVSPLEQIAASAEAVLEQELAFARASGCPVEGRTEFGGAASALVAAGEDADLLVVGSRGLGGLKGALLGSVSTAVVHHAPCPVVVVPPPERVHAASQG